MPNGKGRGRRKAKTKEITRIRRGRNLVAPAIQALPPPVPKPVQQVIPVQPKPKPKPKRAKVDPCGGKPPFAKTSGGQIFCTQQDFLNAGFRQPSRKPAKTKDCPPGFFFDSRIRTGRGSGGVRTGRCRKII